MREYSWIADLALEGKNYSESLGAFFAKAVAKVTFDPVPTHEMKRAWAVLARDMVHLGFDQDTPTPPDLRATIAALEALGVDKFNEGSINEEKLARAIGDFFHKAFDNIS